MTPFTRVKNTSFEPGNISINWFEDGRTNVAYNCVDRHLETRGDQTAIIWEGDDPNDSSTSPIGSCTREVCRLANVLRNRGVSKGDRVTIYLPMIPEAAYAMLACARLGAIHSIVFGGFSPDALAGRIEGCALEAGDHRRRGPARRPQGRRSRPTSMPRSSAARQVVDHVIVVRRTGGTSRWSRAATSTTTRPPRRSPTNARPRR